MRKSRDRTPFGQRMFEARERARFTQMQVCDRLNISQGTLSELERVAHGTKRLVEFAAFYGVDPTWLATGQGSHEISSPVSAAEPPAGYLTDAQARELLADFSELLPEEQAEWRARIRQRAEQMRKHAEVVLRRAGVEPQPPSARKVKRSGR